MIEVRPFALRCAVIVLASSPAACVFSDGQDAREEGVIAVSDEVRKKKPAPDAGAEEPSTDSGTPAPEPVDAGSAQPEWNGDFDNGFVPPWSSSICTGGISDASNQYRSTEGEGNAEGKCPVVTFTSARTRHGSGRAMQISMPPGSQRATPSSTYRWAVPADADGEVDQYVGMSLYFEQGFPGSTWISPISWRVATGDTGSLVVQKKGQNLVFRRSVNASWDGCAPNTACSNDDLDMGPIVQGAWIDFVFRVRYSVNAGTAIRQVWRDGALMGTSTKANVLSGSTYRFRVGMYQDTSTSWTRTLYYDEVRIGTSFESVDPAR